MKKISLIVLIIASSLMSACVAGSGATPITRYNSEPKTISHTKNYAFVMSKDVVRLGAKSQRFELRQGDCGGDYKWNDCKQDRSRTERFTQIDEIMPYVNQVVWVGYSIFIPKDFVGISPANTMIGQVKLTGVGAPIWNMYAAHGKLLFEANASQQRCYVGDLSKLKGKWTDIQIGFDFGVNKSKGEGTLEGKFAEVWVNNKKQTNCKIVYPGINQYNLDSSKSKELHFAWGIYNSYISRWVSYKGKVPTQVLYYDEIRIGKSKQNVDVNLAQKAVD